jgi:hypothetical protein
MATQMPQEALRALLIDLLQGRNESLAQFGKTLAATIHPDREPFTKQYIGRLKAGQDRITPEIGDAMLTLAAMLDGVSELQARARPYQVLATHELPPGVVILGQARGCELPGCRIRFVPASPRQRFCSPECRQEMASRRKAAVKEPSSGC